MTSRNLPEAYVVYHLDRSQLCRLAESPVGRLLPLGKRRRPYVTRMIARDGKFGRDYYELFSSAKVVLNGALGVAAKIAQIRDTFEAGAFRGNSGSDPDIQTFWKGMFRISL